MNCSSFSGGILRIFCVWLSCHLQTMTSSFPIWIPFISFSSLIAMTRTSKTVLNKSGKSGHSCLLPDLRGNAFSFSLFSIMLAVGFFIYGPYCFEVCSFCAHFLESFYHNQYWILSKAFSASVLDHCVVFVLQFTNVVYHTDWFVGGEKSLHPWDKSHLVMVYVPFKLLLGLFF